MESEKVKEIKKLIDCDKKQNEIGGIIVVNRRFLMEVLTLINELESENERLNKSDTSKENAMNEYYNLYKDFKRKNKDLNELCERQRVSIAESFVRENQLKDRIAELEKENAKLLDSVETVQSNRCTIKCELTKNALKQFAEKLKEKAKNLKLGSVKVHNFLWVNDIDETLKEFVKN